MIIVPLESSFANKPGQTQSEIVQELEMRANSAGLRGSVVAVWDAGGGRMGFRAPRPWHPFFQSINLGVVARNINRELSW